MTTHQLKKRYRKTAEEIAGIIQSHLEELHEHARYEKGAWRLDDEGLRRMDGIMGYRDDAPQGSPPEDGDAGLRERLRLAEQRAEGYAEELSSLQERFIQLQNGREAMNSSFIKKHQLRAESAEKELKKIQARFREEMRLKDERLKELEARIADMQEKLVENHDEIERRQQELSGATQQMESIREEAAKRCSKAELLVLESKRSEDKLYRELHESELKISELGQRLAVANEDRSEALRKMADMKSEFTDVKAKLIAITAGLGNYLTELETIPDASILPEEAEELSAGEALPEQPEELPAAKPPVPPISPAIQDERQELLEQLKREQEPGQGRSQGFFSQLMQKAAGLF